MSFFAHHAKRKEQRKQIEHAMFQVKFARRMREDLISVEQRDELRGYQQELKAHLKAGELKEGEKLAEKALKLAKKIHPAHKGKTALRENIEVFVVVMAVALGIRTYFLQPYQIPTGSMQPTLYGITGHVDVEPTWADQMPFKIGKFLLTGAWYTEVRAKADGVMPAYPSWDKSETHVFIPLGGKRHKVQKDLAVIPELQMYQRGVPLPRTPVRKGDVIARGVVKRGDNIVVNRLITNFIRPKRGDIVVFHTGGLALDRKNSAYIKRLTGLPGETMSLNDGEIYADGKRIDSPGVFLRQYEDPRYSGYSIPNVSEYGMQGAYATQMTTANPTLELGEEEYLLMGDNTDNSLDGRYFGAVPGENIMGIGFFVPWPFIQRGIYEDHAGLVK